MPKNSNYSYESIAPWFNSAAQNVVGRAQGLANEEYKAFPTKRLAGSNQYLDNAGYLSNQTQIYEPSFQNSERMMSLSSSPFYSNYAAYLNAPYAHARAAGDNKYLQNADYLSNRTQLYEPSLQNAEAVIGSAASPFYNNYAAYMNPYIDSVVNRISQEGGRTYREQILPQLEANFVGLGQHGGSRHQKMSERAARDLQAEILKRQEEALARGYQQAGQLLTSDQERALNAGKSFVDIARNRQTGNLADIAMLSDISKMREQSDLARLGLAGQLFNADQERALNTAKSFADVGRYRNAGNLADIAMLSDYGNYVRGNEQAQKDVDYSNFREQRDYPYEQTRFLQSILHNLPHESARFSQAQTPAAPQVNALGQLGALATNLYGLKLMSKKHGGHVKKRATFTDIKRIGK